MPAPPPPTPDAPAAHGQHRHHPDHANHSDHRVPSRRRADRARAVADVLRRQIHDGRFATGALPAEAALGSEFGASRNTVREALTLLRDEGLIERVPRLGTLVSGRKYDHGLDRLSGLNETLRTYGPVHNEVRLAQETAAPPGVARRLELTEGAPVVHIERLRLLGGRPVSLDLTYLAPDVGLPLLEQDLEHNDVFALIPGVCGHRLGPAEVSLEAVNADPHSASVLHTPPGAALLLMERLTRLDDGRPVDLEYIRLRGDRITMSARLDGPVPSPGPAALP